MPITDSILNTIKPLLDLSVADTDFDINVIIHINSVLMELNILGLGPSEGYAISSSDETWTDFAGTNDVVKVSAMKSYVYLKVQMLFDPPQTAALIKALQEQINAYEVKINSMAREV
jgi:hypothetical protein